MSKSKVFMIMPFQDEFFEVYNMLKTEFNETFDFTNAGDEDNQQNILKDIIQPIYDADVIIADLTGQNANVLYELGVAHTLNKKCIVITKDDLATLPFDLKQYRTKNYDTHFTKFAELLEYLKKHLHGAVDGKILFGNPVMDFLQTIPDMELKLKANAFSSVEDEKGFLDFMAEIEDDTNALADNITAMTEDLTEMNSGISISSDRVSSVVKNGGSGQANYVRKEAKKVAEIIITFGHKLAKYNSENIDIWNRVELNLVGLLENPHIITEENFEGVQEYISALTAMQDSIVAGNDGVKGFKSSINGIVGVERSLNQAIRALDAELKTYLISMEQIYASIERVKTKGSFLLADKKSIQWQPYDNKKPDSLKHKYN